MIRMTPAIRRLIIIVTVGSMIAMVVSFLNPVNSTLCRIMFLAAAVGTWLGATVVSWDREWCRVFLIVLAVLCALPFLLPGRSINQEELRISYVKRMTELEKTTYHWGGESARGIDCSGLPRRALRDALLSYGMRHADGGAFRVFASQWWFDTSAEAMGQGYRDFTVDLDRQGRIVDMSYDGLKPGDLAVTANGIHVIVYIGDDNWIQADPGIGSVATLNGRTSDNSWFKVPVTLHRWKILVTPN